MNQTKLLKKTSKSSWPASCTAKQHDSRSKKPFPFKHLLPAHHPNAAFKQILQAHPSSASFKDILQEHPSRTSFKHILEGATAPYDL
jgi:hypothetical protein